MATSTLKPIDEKKKQKKNYGGSDINNNNNWSGFGISLLGNLVIAFVVGIAGSNFIYLTRMANVNMSKTIQHNKITVLDYLVPTQKNVYFPDEKVRENVNEYLKNIDSSTLTNCGKDNSCAAAEACTNYKLLANLNIGTLGGWPYSMRDPKVPAPWGLWGQFKYWIADSVANAYIRNRSKFKNIMKLFAPSEKATNSFSSPLQMFLITPLIYVLTPFVMLFIFFSCLYSLFATSPGWAIVGTLFFLTTFFINYGMCFVQAFQYLCTLTFVPLLADFKMVKNIFKCNGHSLVHFFLIFTCISAFMNLDPIIAGTITGTYGVYVIYTLFKLWW